MEMSLRRMHAAGVAAVALSLTAFAAGASEARAGAYHVYGCRTPSGQPAPADGWSGSVATGGAFDQYARNTCAEGGALIAAVGYADDHRALSARTRFGSVYIRITRFFTSSALSER